MKCTLYILYAAAFLNSNHYRQLGQTPSVIVEKAGISIFISFVTWQINIVFTVSSASTL